MQRQARAWRAAPTVPAKQPWLMNECPADQASLRQKATPGRGQLHQEDRRSSSFSRREERWKRFAPERSAVWGAPTAPGDWALMGASGSHSISQSLTDEVLQWSSSTGWCTKASLLYSIFDVLNASQRTPMRYHQPPHAGKKETATVPSSKPSADEKCQFNRLFSTGLQPSAGAWLLRFSDYTGCRNATCQGCAR